MLLKNEKLQPDPVVETVLLQETCSLIRTRVDSIQYCTVLYCTYCNLLYRLYSTVKTVLYCTDCTVLKRMYCTDCTVLYSLYCTVLYRLYFTVYQGWQANYNLSKDFKGETGQGSRECIGKNWIKILKNLRPKFKGKGKVQC